MQIAPGDVFWTPAFMAEATKDPAFAGGVYSWRGVVLKLPRVIKDEDYVSVCLVCSFLLG